jgi:hypothetical protein
MRFTVSVLVVQCWCSALAQPTPSAPELNTLMFESTFKLQQQVDPQHVVVGTGFIMGRPMQKKPGQARYVLVTAQHVFDGMKGDDIQVILHRRGSDGKWSRVPMPLNIRNKGKPLWMQHPTADVAVMYINLPDGVIRPGLLLPTTMLADDKTLQDLELHPGDELNCLGFPNGVEANDYGFPILRSGGIASYPLLPTKEIQTFLFDFEVFGGNSGGPVYLVHSNRVYQGSTHIGVVQIVVGLVSQQAEMGGQRLVIAKVVHASLIKEALELLSPPDEP